MRDKKNNKNQERPKRASKKFSVLFYAAAGLIIIFVVAGFFIFSNKTPSPASIYVSSENVKQGDTVFIGVESQAGQVAGNFAQEKLLFYKQADSSDWISFLGIDADQNPGDYKISVDTSNAEHLTKNIKVSLAGFSGVPATPAPAITKNGYTPGKALNNIRTKDNPVLNKIVDNFTAAPYFNAPFSFPLSKIAKNGFSFGQFIGLAGSKIQHLGVDLNAPEKTEVYAVNDGKVVLAAALSNYGNTVVIDHGLGIFSLYLHLDKFNVSPGDMVRRGQGIGLSGDTGYVTGPHLHFSMRVDASRVDPLAFIKTSQDINNSNPIISAASIGNAVLNFFK
jgi:murein DD-endopeptidase MepM/ murein hydrolase activator NlpD